MNEYECSAVLRIGVSPAVPGEEEHLFDTFARDPDLLIEQADLPRSIGSSRLVYVFDSSAGAGLLPEAGGSIAADDRTYYVMPLLVRIISPDEVSAEEAAEVLAEREPERLSEWGKLNLVERGDLDR